MTADTRPALLLYLAGPDDPHRLSVPPALAAIAERAGVGFELYRDALRRGRHFGGGDPDRQRPGQSGGGLFLGGLHAERGLWLARRFRILAAGDPASALWPALEAGGAEVVAASADPAEIYAAVLSRLELPTPPLVRVLDASPQGPRALVTAPYLYPALLSGPSALAVDVSASAALRAALEAIGATEFHAIGADPRRAERFPGGLAEAEALEVGNGYAELTAQLARRHRDWGRGILLGDPELVAAQLPKARRLRLLPLYGTPQVDVLAAVPELLAAAREPVFGRQYDDRDFFALSAAGHGLQVLDPSPPFDAAQAQGPPARASVPATPGDGEPDDPQLERWADEGIVLVTLLFWSGMLRELDCIPRLVDLVAETGLASGLIVTAETVEHGAPEMLAPLAVPVDRGGVLGRLEPLLGSTGRGVAAEAYMPPGALAAHLAEAIEAITRRAPSLRPRGWWPLLDAGLVPHREVPVGWRGRRPVVRYSPRGEPPALEGESGPPGARAPERRDLRGLVGSAARAFGLDALLEARRPFDDQRPGDLDQQVVRAVRAAGLEYMWTKTSFGVPRAAVVDGDFVALPFTAGNWDGWSPFYTVGRAADLHRAERRMQRSGRPGWLASTVDSPLFALSGEVWEHGARLHDIARSAAGGGRSGRLVNVTPHVVARYARLLRARGADVSEG
ncbi:MAG TPA: hypothetical protein VES79_14165 [Solirubrobacteraceae bacterium]|nr:hypothetical protein [Solirubrobacteraceae bacterium]